MESSDAEVLSAFVRQFYLQTDFVPDQVHLPCMPEDGEDLGAWLSAKNGGRVALAAPQRGPKAHMLDTAEKNAAHQLKERQLKRELQKGRLPQGLVALKRDLKLDGEPRRIEGIDISHFQGSDTVGSLVCLLDGKPRRSEYRHFKIRDLDRPDDFASMYQVVHRRFRGLRERDEPFPDLLMVDGGKGQLSSALQALEDLGIREQPVVGLAKRLEEVFLPGRGESLLLPKVSASLRLLQILRDEAHRFALTFSRELRAKRTLTSALDSVPGIGPKRRTALLKTFGSVRRIKEADIDAIARVDGFSQDLARSLKSHLAAPAAPEGEKQP